MTPKEKAIELVDNYQFILTDKTFGKDCALVAVDELIESHLLLTTTHDSEPSIRCKRYWQEVKQEIQAL
jgi:hypothetical protein